MVYQALPVAINRTITQHPSLVSPLQYLFTTYSTHITCPFYAMFTPLLLLSTFLPLLVSSETFRSRTKNPGLTSQLKTAATNYDRNTLLPSDTDWYYDFDSHPNYNSPSGAVIIADAASFPALTGMGISVSLLKLAPCGMLPPHLHPRATNLVTAMTGNTTSYMIGENGVGVHRVDLVPLRVTIFPQGSVHVMQNNGTSEPFSIIFCHVRELLMYIQVAKNRSSSAPSTATTAAHSTSFPRCGKSSKISSKRASAMRASMRKMRARTFRLLARVR